MKNIMYIASRESTKHFTHIQFPDFQLVISRTNMLGTQLTVCITDPLFDI